jgi:hypothetical protein
MHRIAIAVSVLALVASCASHSGGAVDSGPLDASPSCKGLTATCGPSGDASCCASSLVLHGTFYRGYDGVTYTDQGYPATVSDFRLDTYEVTVNRFRQFVMAYPEDMPAAGSRYVVTAPSLSVRSNA